MSQPRPQPSRIPASVALIVLLLLGFIAWVGQRIIAPPEPSPANAAADSFSAIRAMRHIERIAAKPRPSGSEAHAEARQWIVGALGELGLEAQVTRRDATIARSRLVVAASVQNIVARMPGRDAGPAVLLMAHYDTRPQTPGAGDDAIGVAALLETARALRARPVLGRDVIFLVTDGEESGLLGARAFLEHHPWRKDIGVVVNVEARGQRGPAILFEIVGNSESALVAAARRADLGTVASSLTSTVYRTLPNDTDLTPFGKAGIAGVNLAIIGGMTAYHTPLDTVDALDRRSVQDLGAALLGMTVELGENPIDGASRSPPGSTVYFDLLGGPLLAYPRVLALVFAALAVVLWLLAWRSVRSPATPGILATLIRIVPSLLIVVPVVFYVAWSILRRLVPDLARAPYALPYDQDAVLIGFVLLATGAAGLLLARLRGSAAPAMILVAALLPWALLAIALAVVLPGTSYLAAWPLIGASVGLLIASRRGASSSSGQRISIVVGILPAMLVLVPVGKLLADALTINAILVIGVVAALIGLFAAPFVASLGRLSWVLVVAGSVLLAWLAMQDRPSAERPTTASLMFRQDVDTGKAEWLAFGPSLETWRAALMGDEAVRGPIGFPVAGSAQGFMAAAPVVSMPAPQLAVITDEPSFLRLRLTSPRGAPAARLRIAPSTPDGGVEAVWIGAERKVLDGEREEPVTIWLTGLPEFGVPIGIERRGAIIIDVADQRYDFLDLGDHAPSFPADRVAPPSWYTDSTFVTKRFEF